MNLLLFVFISFISFVFSVDNGLGLLPPMGWNTWCTLGECGRDFCNEKEIMQIGDAMVAQGLQKLGFEYVNLDDCWALDRGPNGEIRADPSRFPNGMKYTADYLHSIGLKFGLYTDSGRYTCSQGGRDHPIPGSYLHYAQDAETYASWHIDYVKQDWCNTKINGTELNPKQVYAEMSRALNDSGRPMFFLSCEWGYESPWNWARSFMNAWRSYGDHHDNWENTLGIIEASSSKEIAEQSGPGGFNYNDFLMTGGQGCKGGSIKDRCPGMTDTEYFTEYSLWVMANSPLIVASSLIDMTPLQKEILMNPHMLRIVKDPLSRAGYRVGISEPCSSGQSNCQVWARRLFDGDVYLVLFNSGSSAADISFDANLIGWANATISSFDLWKHTEMPKFMNHFTAQQVPSHGIRAFRLSLTPRKADK